VKRGRRESRLHRWATFTVQCSRLGITMHQICALWDAGLVEDCGTPRYYRAPRMRIVRGVTCKQALAALAVMQTPRHGHLFQKKVAQAINTYSQFVQTFGAVTP